MGSFQEWVYPGLFVFGLFYNGVMALAEQRGYSEGLLSLFVAAGSAVTIGGIWLLDPDAATISLQAFFLSGLPMVVGSLWRYIHKREKTQERYRKGDG